MAARDGGPYLDEVELCIAETRRAAIEGREPDYSQFELSPGQRKNLKLDEPEVEFEDPTLFDGLTDLEDEGENDGLPS